MGEGGGGSRARGPRRGAPHRRAVAVVVAVVVAAAPRGSRRSMAGPGPGWRRGGGRGDGPGHGRRPAAAAAAAALRLAGCEPGGSADPRLAADAEDDPQRGAQDRRVPQRRPGAAGRRGRAVPLQVQRRIKALSSLRV